MSYVSTLDGGEMERERISSLTFPFGSELTFPRF